MTVHIGAYEMEQVILDLGLDVNVLPKKTWYRMGEPKLEWSTIQLHMANQQKIIPLGRLSQVVVNIEGVKVMENFEVIQILDDIDPYPTMLGLDWAIDMDGVINLKKRRMEFESNGVGVTIPLDPTEGKRYTDLVHADDDIDQIYKLTLHEEYWINPKTVGNLKWD